jgi:hypothetical protein
MAAKLSYAQINIRTKNAHFLEKRANFSYFVVNKQEIAIVYQIVTSVR